MSEFVAISDGDPADRDAFHTVEDGTTKCGISKKRTHDFIVVPLSSVDDDLNRCKLCSGEAISGGGQGSTLVAKLVAADPEEVAR